MIEENDFSLDIDPQRLNCLNWRQVLNFFTLEEKVGDWSRIKSKLRKKLLLFHPDKIGLQATIQHRDAATRWTILLQACLKHINHIMTHPDDTPHRTMQGQVHWNQCVQHVQSQGTQSQQSPALLSNPTDLDLFDQKERLRLRKFAQQQAKVHVFYVLLEEHFDLYRDLPVWKLLFTDLLQTKNWNREINRKMWLRSRGLVLDVVALQKFRPISSVRIKQKRSTVIQQGWKQEKNLKWNDLLNQYEKEYPHQAFLCAWRQRAWSFFLAK